MTFDTLHVCMCEYRKHRSSVGPSKPVSQPRRNIVGCRIQHGWKEGSGPVTQWKGTVLDQVPVNPSLYLIKYDGFDCVYGLELNKDERVSALEVLPDRVGKFCLLFVLYALKVIIDIGAFLLLFCTIGILIFVGVLTLLILI